MGEGQGPMGGYNERAVELVEELSDDLTLWGEKDWRSVAAKARELAEIAEREAAAAPAG